MAFERKMAHQGRPWEARIRTKVKKLRQKIKMTILIKQTDMQNKLYDEIVATVA